MSDKRKATMVAVEIDPRCAYDVIDRGVLILRGHPVCVTPTEAKSFLALRDEHGTPLVRKVVVPAKPSEQE